MWENERAPERERVETHRLMPHSGQQPSQTHPSPSQAKYLLSTRQCVDTAHCVVRPNYNQDQGAQGESRFRLGPWTKGQSACTYGTTGMTCPVVLNFNAIRTHCDCDCDAITRVFCWGLVSSFFFLFFLFLGQGKGSFPSLDSPHHCNYKGKKKTQNEVNVTEQGS